MHCGQARCIANFRLGHRKVETLGRAEADRVAPRRKLAKQMRDPLPGVALAYV